MPAFGDVLRGLGSVLNPQVAQEMAAEDRQKQQLANQIGLMGLQQRLQEQTPEYQAKVEALNNERAYRQAVAQAGGDENKIALAGMQYGKPELAANILDRKERRLQVAQQASDNLSLKMVQLDQLHEERLRRAASDEEKAAETKRHNMETEAGQAQARALQAEIARGNQEIKRLQFDMTADKQLQANVTKLGTALEKANLPQADAVLGDVEDVLKKTPRAAEYLAGPKALMPDWAVPDDVKFARQAFSKLFNITLKDRSGAAVTNQELERLKQEFASGAFKTPQQLQNAVDRARNIINKHYASVAAGFGGETLSAYNENIRGFGGRVVLGDESKVTPKVVNFSDLK